MPHGVQVKPSTSAYFHSNTTGRRGGTKHQSSVGEPLGAEKRSTFTNAFHVQHAKSHNDINSVNAEATAWNLYNMAHSKSESKGSFVKLGFDYPFSLRLPKGDPEISSFLILTPLKIFCP